MPWQGQTDNLIDRFDVRAHLDHIPPLRKEEGMELTQEERHLNYERYRIVAQNSYLGISEEKFLKQLHLEEQFGYTETKTKKESKGTGAAIGFNYEEGTAVAMPSQDSVDDNSDEYNSDSDLDVDLAINVSKIDSTQAHEMNKHGRNFGMAGNDFYSFLTNDLEEAETFRLAKEEEHEKALFSGRKSRRERRAHREKRLANRTISPPSYAARDTTTRLSLRDESKSPSKSPSPDAGKITYITSFGDDEEAPSSSRTTTYADKVKYGKSRKQELSAGRPGYYNRRSGSREVSYKRRRKSRSWSRTRRSWFGRNRSGSRSRNGRFKSRRSISKTRRSRSRSRRSRSKSYSRSRFTRSRSIGRKSRSRSNDGSLHSTSSASSSSDSSKSKSSSRSLSKNSNRSPNKSPSVKKEISPPAPPRIMPRYYGRKRSDQSSSESDNSEEEKMDVDLADNMASGDSKFGHGNNSGTEIKKTSNLSVMERLRRKRQALINKQFKKDKIAEELKAEREKQEQQTREDELREMAIKLRKRQREKRHAYDSNRSSDSSDSDKSNSSKHRDKSESPKNREKDLRKYDKENSRGLKDRSRSKERSRRTSNDRDRRSSSRNRRQREKEGRRERSRERERKLVDY
ncbi:CLK4-associating serine/arginine rich protein isoform X2 [Cylas formicarius]|nr:CLK4-associating serine/arginine rich protein isoform X2 [Cylas formicarius]